jgi:hypothetical protein
MVILEDILLDMMAIVVNSMKQWKKLDRGKQIGK